MGKNWRGGEGGMWVLSVPWPRLVTCRTGEQRDASLIPSELGAPCAPACVRTACPWVLGPFPGCPHCGKNLRKTSLFHSSNGRGQCQGGFQGGFLCGDFQPLPTGLSPALCQPHSPVSLLRGSDVGGDGERGGGPGRKELAGLSVSSRGEPQRSLCMVRPPG